jgi:hypothetical protein
MNSKLAGSQKKLEAWGWRFPDPAVAGSLHVELRRELPPGHLLFGCVVEVVAFREDQDDVLFRHANHPDRFTVVHLTWIRKQEINAQHPTVCFDGSFAEFLASEQESRRDYIFKPSVRIGPKQYPQILQMAAGFKILCVAAYLTAIALLMVRLPFGLADHHRFWIIPVVILFGALWLAEAFFTRIVLSSDNIRVVSVSEFKSFTIPRDQIESVTWAKGLGSVLKLRDGKEVRLPTVGRRTNQGLANTIRAWLGKAEA